MKWVKLLWAVVVTSALFGGLFLLDDRYSVDESFGYSLLKYCFYGWIALMMVSGLLILLRLFRVVKKRDSFGYICLAVLNLVCGGFGLFAFWSNDMDSILSWPVLFCLVQVAMAGFMFSDFFIKGKAMA
jgi:hypothetical protein